MSQSCKDDKKKRKNFSSDEIHCLIDIWGSSAIQAKFEKAMRHNMIYEEIATKMSSVGYNRTSEEVKSKINNLKTEYSRIKKKEVRSGKDNQVYALCNP